MPDIQLQSSDGEIFGVDKEIAKKSIMIKTMLEDLGIDEEEDEEIVPLPNVNAATLQKVWNFHNKTYINVWNTLYNLGVDIITKMGLIFSR